MVAVSGHISRDLSAPLDISRSPLYNSRSGVSIHSIHSICSLLCLMLLTQGVPDVPCSPCCSFFFNPPHYQTTRLPDYTTLPLYHFAHSLACTLSLPPSLLAVDTHSLAISRARSPPLSFSALPLFNPLVVYCKEKAKKKNTKKYSPQTSQLTHCR